MYSVKGFGIEEYGIEWGYEDDRIVVSDANERVEVDSEKDAIAMCEDMIIQWAQDKGCSEAEILALRIRIMDYYDSDLLKQLCDMAGLSEEWDEADGETFESVAQRAADILGVEI